MNQNIIAYLSENKEKYSKDVLVAELRKVGYAEGDIIEGVAEVFEGKAPSPASANTSFWNFKDKKVYTSAGQKWKDFLFGVFTPLFAQIILMPIGFFLRGASSLLLIMLWIVALVYVFKRRRMMFYGMIALPIIFIPLAILLVLTPQGVRGF